MGDNLQWLFGAFAAGWIIHMLYLLSISSRQSKVMKQLGDLQALLPNRESETKPD